jgi:hypothetical protein
VGAARLTHCAALLAALLAMALPAPAQEALSEQALLSADRPDRIATYMRQLGYRAELVRDETGDPMIETGMAGLPAVVWFYECTDGRDCLAVQFQIGILTERKWTLDDVNRFNAETRFAKLYLDPAGDPILLHDLAMPAPGVAASAFRDSLGTFERHAVALYQRVTEREGSSARR